MNQATITNKQLVGKYRDVFNKHAEGAGEALQYRSRPHVNCADEFLTLRRRVVRSVYRIFFMRTVEKNARLMCLCNLVLQVSLLLLCETKKFKI